MRVLILLCCLSRPFCNVSLAAQPDKKNVDKKSVVDITRDVKSGSVGGMVIELSNGALLASSETSGEVRTIKKSTNGGKTWVTKCKYRKVKWARQL